MSRTLLAISPKPSLFGLLIGMMCLLLGCTKPVEKDSLEKEPATKTDYIRPIAGEDQAVAEELVKLGEVLIAYSDCYDCHTLENRAKGPSFLDISKRYPIRQVYIDLLARKVISGGTGSWGYPVMSPHPTVSFEDAQTMVTFILSLRQKTPQK